VLDETSCYYAVLGELNDLRPVLTVVGPTWRKRQSSLTVRAKLCYQQYSYVLFMP